MIHSSDSSMTVMSDILPLLRFWNWILLTTREKVKKLKFN